MVTKPYLVLETERVIPRTCGVFFAGQNFLRGNRFVSAHLHRYPVRCEHRVSILRKSEILPHARNREAPREVRGQKFSSSLSFRSSAGLTKLMFPAPTKTRFCKRAVVRRCCPGEEGDCGRRTNGAPASGFLWWVKGPRRFEAMDGRLSSSERVSLKEPSGAMASWRMDAVER